MEIARGVDESIETFENGNKQLESESEPTINRLAETVFEEEERLKDFIRSDVSDVVSKDFAKNLLADLRERFPNHGLDCLASCYGNFLDPRLKGIHLEEIGELHDYVEGITRNISTYEVEKEAEEDDESIVSDVNENLTPTEKLLMKKTPAQNQEVKSKSVIAAEKEIETHRNLPPCPQDQSVLWWKSHQDILPRLSVLAS